MKVEQKVPAASPDGVVAPGTERDLPKKDAEALIAGGYAAPVGGIVERATRALKSEKGTDSRK